MEHQLKTYVTMILPEFYPQDIIEKFSPKGKWLNEIKDPNIIRRYINCLDARIPEYIKNAEHYRQKLYSANCVNVPKMSNFLRLNKMLLEDTLKKTTNELLQKYYRIHLCLNDGSTVLERDKMNAMAHRLESKIIDFYNQPKPFNINEMQRFLVIVALFSNCDYCHNETTREQFVDMVDIFED